LTANSVYVLYFIFNSSIAVSFFINFDWTREALIVMMIIH